MYERQVFNVAFKCWAFCWQWVWLDIGWGCILLQSTYHLFGVCLYSAQIILTKTLWNIYEMGRDESNKKNYISLIFWERKKTWLLLSWWYLLKMQKYIEYHLEVQVKCKISSKISNIYKIETLGTISLLRLSYCLVVLLPTKLHITILVYIIKLVVLIPTIDCLVLGQSNQNNRSLIFLYLLFLWVVNRLCATFQVG